MGNFILVDEPYTKALEILKIHELVNNNLWEKLASSLERATTFGDRFKVPSVPFLFWFSFAELKIRQCYIKDN